MNVQNLRDEDGRRSFVLVFDTDDDVMSEILRWARESGVDSASFTGIGAFRAATLGFFDVDLKDYLRITVNEQVEVLSLSGNIAVADGGPKVHAHVVLGRRDGTALGGHLLDARVRPTLELVVNESGTRLRRRIDRATGLPLLEVGS